MKNTSIDGLTVRSPRNRSASAARRSRGKSSSATPKNPNPRTAKTMDVSPRNSSQRKKVKLDDFLEPVHSLEVVEEDDFATQSTEDWSDLLGQMSDSNEKSLEDDLGSSFNNGNWTEADDDLLAEEFGAKKNKKKSKKPKKSGKNKKKRRRIVLLVIFLVLLFAVVAIYIWGDALISRLTGGNSGLMDVFSSVWSETVPFEADENGRTNVLVFGTEGYDMSGSSGRGVHDGAQLTDSIMVISFDQETKDVALLSLPRDLKVPMACSAGKINEVFWCHNKDGTNEEAGANALMEQVGEILGIDFQYYAHINWGSLVSIVDTLGGITVTLDESINDRGWTNAVVKAGVPTTVNGEQALGLARARHGTSGGDFTRGNTQQKIVEAIIQKIIDEGIGATEALNLLNILGDNLRTNFSADNIKAGVELVSGFDVASMRQVPLVDYDTNTYYVKSATINNISYVVPSAGVGNFQEIQAYVDKMFSSDPAVREGAVIAIYNSTNTSGLAAAERDKLAEKGIDVERIGDAPAGSCNEQYCVYAINEELSGTKQLLAEIYGVEVKAASEVPAGVDTTGFDFVIVIGTAPSLEGQQ